MDTKCSPLSSTPTGRPFNTSLKITVPPLCQVLFEELSFPTPCYITNCPPSPHISPIKTPSLQTPSLQTPSHQTHDVSLRLVDTTMEESQLKEIPQISAIRRLNPTKLDRIDGFCVGKKSTMNMSFLDCKLDTSHILSQMTALQLSEDSSTLGPHRSRRGRGIRTMSAEQRSTLDKFVNRSRFASGSDRNVIARQIGIPASELFMMYGRKMTS